MTEDILKEIGVSYRLASNEILANQKHLHPHWENLHDNFNKYIKDADMWENFRN